MRRQLRQRMLSDMCDVLRFFFLDFGCMQYRGAYYLSEGILDNSIIECQESECQSCPICTSEWHKLHLPVFRSEVIRLFDSNTGRSIFPFLVDNKKPLSTVLSTRPYWVKWIFDKAARSVLVRHIDAFMFSLLAANIIRIEKNRSGDLVWNLTWRDSMTPNYKTDDVWDSINLRERL